MAKKFTAQKLHTPKQKGAKPCWLTPCFLLRSRSPASLKGYAVAFFAFCRKMVELIGIEPTTS